MKAQELSLALEAAAIPGDAHAQLAICKAFRVLRDFIAKNVTTQKGIGGTVFRALFPKTAEGLKAVVTLLDDYLAAHCRTSI